LKKQIILFAIVVLTLTSAFASGPRKVMVIAPTEYPVLARQMNVEGAVKIEAVVEPNGKIKDAKIIGGHPLLVDAALKSAKKFQFEPTGSESVETITINFKRNN